MNNQQKDRLSKNKYELGVKKFIDELHEQISEFEQEISEVEEASREDLHHEIARLKRKKIEFEKKAREIKTVGLEQLQQLDQALTELSHEINAISDGLRKGFSYLLEKLEK